MERTWPCLSRAPALLLASLCCAVAVQFGRRQGSRDLLHDSAIPGGTAACRAMADLDKEFKCCELYVAHPSMRIMETWGDLSARDQALWRELDCDRFKTRLDDARHGFGDDDAPCTMHSQCPARTFCAVGSSTTPLPACHRCKECVHDGDGVVPCVKHCRASQLGMSAATVVSAYYTLTSKRPSKTYRDWMRNTLKVCAPLVVYTDAQSLPFMKRLRPVRLHPVTRFVIDGLDARNWSKPYGADFWKQQRTVDPERSADHSNISSDLYRVWASKLEMLDAAASANSFGSETFWWVDIGSLRTNLASFRSPWPSPDRVAWVRRGTPIVVRIRADWPIVGERGDYISGMGFGGTADAVSWLSKSFYGELHKRAARGDFIGVDQTILNYLVHTQPEKFAFIDAYKEHNSCGRVSKWFVFWHYMGGSWKKMGCLHPFSPPQTSQQKLPSLSSAGADVRTPRRVACDVDAGLHNQSNLRLCCELYLGYPSTVPRKTWGDMPKHDQVRWSTLDCDKYAHALKRIEKRRRWLRDPQSSGGVVPARSKQNSHSSPVLAVCNMIHDESKYVHEWVQHMHVMGFTRIVLYDDSSTDLDAMRAALQHEIASGVVEIVSVFPQVILNNSSTWYKGLDAATRVKGLQLAQRCNDFISGGRKNAPGENNGFAAACQRAAYFDCIARIGPQSDWLTTVDVDEFLFPCKRGVETVTQLFSTGVNAHSYQLRCLRFGHSGLKRPPKGASDILRTHTHRAPYEMMGDRDAKTVASQCQNTTGGLCQVGGGSKYISRTTHLVKQATPHTVWLKVGSTMENDPDVTHQELGLCCNHYAMRSTLEMLHKAKFNFNPFLERQTKSQTAMNFYNAVKDVRILAHVSGAKQHSFGNVSVISDKLQCIDHDDCPTRSFCATDSAAMSVCRACTECHAALPIPCTANCDPQPLHKKQEQCVAVLVHTPRRDWSEFLARFVSYRTFVVVDAEDGEFSLPHGVTLVRVSAASAIRSGFQNLNTKRMKKPTSAWDKALYYFSVIGSRAGSECKNVWLIEDDVYFHDEETLLRIDAQFPTADLLSKQAKPDVANSWRWGHKPYRDYADPYPAAMAKVASMVCAVRLSRKLLERIRSFAAKHRAFPFLESFFPMIVRTEKLIHETPPAFRTIVFQPPRQQFEWPADTVDAKHLFHPMKDANRRAALRLRDGNDISVARSRITQTLETLTD